MKKDFKLIIETLHLPDAGDQSNVSQTTFYQLTNFCRFFFFFFSFSRLYIYLMCDFVANYWIKTNVKTNKWEKMKKK